MTMRRQLLGRIATSMTTRFGSPPNLAAFSGVHL